MRRPHVWIIGFPRCGSASLCEALRILGWNPIHNPRHWDQIEGHNAAGDVMITAHWRELLGMTPRAKFILNTRDFDAWTKSLLQIPGFWSSPLLYDRFYRQTVYYGAGIQDQQALRYAWDRHHALVRSLIPASRLLDLPFPLMWEPLCKFLGVRIPDEPFPWLNRQSNFDAQIRIE